MRTDIQGRRRLCIKFAILGSKSSRNQDAFVHSLRLVIKNNDRPPSSSSSYTPSNRALPMGMVQSASASHASFDPPKMNAYSAGTSAGTSSIAHYDPYAPPRRPTTVSAPVASSSTTGKALRKFKRLHVLSQALMSYSHSFS